MYKPATSFNGRVDSIILSFLLRRHDLSLSSMLPCCSDSAGFKKINYIKF